MNIPAKPGVMMFVIVLRKGPGLVFKFIIFVTFVLHRASSPEIFIATVVSSGEREFLRRCEHEYGQNERAKLQNT